MLQKCVHFAGKLVENTTTFLAGVHFYQTVNANTSLKLVVEMYISLIDMGMALIHLKNKLIRNQQALTRLDVSKSNSLLI